MQDDPLKHLLELCFSWPVYPLGCAVAVLVVIGGCYYSREGLPDTSVRLWTLFCIAIWPIVALMGAGLGVWYSLRYVWQAVEVVAYVATLPFEIAGALGAKRQVPEPGPAPEAAEALPIPHAATSGSERCPVPYEGA